MRLSAPTQGGTFPLSGTTGISNRPIVGSIKALS
ncbi:hypothetical protein QFZ82_007542 [Streptomyces sp. V4I23]|nr:hypothetical protein [Streptomyces sp. V4I23]